MSDLGIKPKLYNPNSTNWAKKTDNTMKTKSIRTNKRGRWRISAKTSEKWFERMNSTQTSKETEVTNTENENGERIPTRCSHVVRMVEHIRRRYVLRYNTVTECTEYMERDGNGTFLMPT